MRLLRIFFAPFRRSLYRFRPLRLRGAQRTFWERSLLEPRRADCTARAAASLLALESTRAGWPFKQVLLAVTHLPARGWLASPARAYALRASWLPARALKERLEWAEPVQRNRHPVAERVCRF